MWGTSSIYTYIYIYIYIYIITLYMFVCTMHIQFNPFFIETSGTYTLYNRVRINTMMKPR